MFHVSNAKAPSQHANCAASVHCMRGARLCLLTSCTPENDMEQAEKAAQGSMITVCDAAKVTRLNPRSLLFNEKDRTMIPRRRITAQITTEAQA